MSLPRRALGRSGLEITTVGFGAWAAGGGGWSFGWGPQDDADSIAAIRHAVSRGVNWIDTAAVYGLGHSEEVVGRALKEIPAGERPYVFTKCGLHWDKANPMTPSRRALRPDTIPLECEESLKRLQTERIDLFQFHWPDESGIAVEDSWAALVKLVDEGKVRAVGVSNFGVPLLERCEAVRHVDSLQPPFSPVRRGVAEADLPWCRAHDTGVIVYSPMQSGLLTERFSEERLRALPADDWRRRGPEFQPPRLQANLALRDALVPLARERGVSVGAVAIAWTLAWPGVTGAIVGARSPEQVDGWIAGGRVALDGRELDAIAEAIGRTGAGHGPARPPRASGD
jgi:aryl-alcohol dehydrogenase-like predicted oxidoreductase